MRTCTVVILIFTVSAFAGIDFRSYITVVANAKHPPVLLAPLADGPGFTITNKSPRAIADLTFGCVTQNTNTDDVQVRFLFSPKHVAVEPRHQKKLEGMTSYQWTCSSRGSAITVLEVLWEGGKKWRRPHQIRDAVPLDSKPPSGEQDNGIIH